jgi:hypothetical protein
VLRDTQPNKVERRAPSRRPRGTRERRRRRQLFFLAALLVCGAAVGFFELLKSANGVQAFDPRADVIKMAHNLVRSAIRPDFHTSFSGPAETEVEAQNDKFRVAGWVDVVADNGNSSRHHYSCFVYRNQAGDWVGDHVSVMPD